MTPQKIGHEIRRWRTHRRRSQLDLALDAGISTRHLSFVETAAPDQPRSDPQPRRTARRTAPRA